jgi:hypothetical protein
MGLVSDKPAEQRRIVRPPADRPTTPNVPESERHGWGEDPNDARRDRDWYENERPPHHGD